MHPMNYDFRPLTIDQLRLIKDIEDPIHRRACSFILSPYAHHDTRTGSGWVVLGREAAELCHGLSKAQFSRKRLSSPEFWRMIAEDVLGCEYYEHSHFHGRRDRARYARIDTDEAVIKALREAWDPTRRPTMYHPVTKQALTEAELDAFLEWRADTYWKGEERKVRNVDPTIDDWCASQAGNRIRVQEADYKATLEAISRDEELSPAQRVLHIRHIQEFYADPRIEYVGGDSIGSSRAYLTGIIATLPGRYRRMLYGNRMASIDIRAHNPSVLLMLARKHAPGDIVVRASIASRLCDPSWASDQADTVSRELGEGHGDVVARCIKRFRTELINAPKKTNWAEEAETREEVAVMAGVSGSEEATNYRVICRWFAENVSSIPDPHGRFHDNANALLTAYEHFFISAGISVAEGNELIRNHDEVMLIGEGPSLDAAVSRVAEAIEGSLRSQGVETRVRVSRGLIPTTPRHLRFHTPGRPSKAPHVDRPTDPKQPPPPKVSRLDDQLDRVIAELRRGSSGRRRPPK